METILGLVVGICLSAACGFRVFVPMMGMSMAALSGIITLSPGFAWMGTWTALTAFTTATLIEIGTYYIPWLDNIMDALMTPVAVAAGTMVTASMIVGDIPPFLKWSLAIIAGGGVSAIVHGGAAALRAGSTGTTGGSANSLIATIELAGSVLVTILAVFLPLLGLVAVIWICYKMISSIAKSGVIKKLFA